MQGMQEEASLSILLVAANVSCNSFSLQTKAKLEEKRELLNGPIDPATGRPLYKPEVGRGPRNVARNPDGTPVHEYLYVNGLEALNRKEAQLEAERAAERETANIKKCTGAWGSGRWGARSRDGGCCEG